MINNRQIVGSLHLTERFISDLQEDVQCYDGLEVKANSGSCDTRSRPKIDWVEVISGAVPTKQTAACWLVASRDGRFVYTANAGSGSISGFRVGHDGSLQPLNSDGRTGVIGDGSHPVDLAESRDGRFLYSLANGNGTIVGFRTKANGALEPLTVVSGIPNSAAGLAGR